MPARVNLLAAAAALSFLLDPARPLCAGEAAGDLDDIKGVEAFLDQFFREKMAERHVPGAVFVLVKDGRVTLAKGFGYADRERQLPVVPDKTTFRVASVSKLFTATAVMQLVERGRLKLDEDVNHYLHGFQLRETFPKPVTLANLLTHTGGFDERTIGVSAHTRADVQPLGQYLARVSAWSLPPGDVISYSNHGMALAGLVVEETSGVPFARYVEENVLEPLGMRHSSFVPGEELEGALAAGYDYDKDTDGYRALPRWYRNDGPAGQLVATGTDMAAFMIAHLRDGRYRDTRILKEATAREMHRQHFTQHPRLPGCAYGFFERFENGRRSLEHAGDLVGAASLLFLLPAEGVGFFVSYNRDDFKLRGDLVQAFLDRYYPAAPAPFPAPPADFARRAGLFAGWYRYNLYSRTTLEKPLAGVQQIRIVDGGDGTLTIQIPEILREVLGPIRLVEVEPLLFRRDDGDRFAAFRMGPDGRITHLALNVLGAAVVLEKVPWYQTPAVQGGLAAGFLAIFVSACVVVPVAALFRWWRRSPQKPLTPRLTPWLAFLVSALNLAFVGGLAAVVAKGDLEYGVPPALPALLAVPLVAAGLTAMLAVCVFLTWRNGTGSALRRWYLSLVALASVGFVFFLDSWNLLGFRY